MSKSVSTIISLAVTVVVTFLAVYYISSVTLWETAILNSAKGSTTAPITGQTSCVQTFTAAKNGLRSFAVLLNPSEKKEESVFRIRLIDSDGKIIASRDYYAGDMKAPEYYDFSFHPISDSENKLYSIEISSEADSGSAIAAWASEGDVYSDGALMIDSADSGTDLVFQVSYISGFSGRVLPIICGVLSAFIAIAYIAFPLKEKVGLKVKIFCWVLFSLFTAVLAAELYAIWAFKRRISVMTTLFSEIGAYRIVLLFIAVFIASAFLFFDRKKTFDFYTDHRYILVGSLFVVLVVLQIHGFSLGRYDDFLRDYNNPASVTIFGEQRQITSDGFGIMVPMIFSQCESGFPLYNYSISPSGVNALLYNLPAWDITIVGRPAYWGFLFLGKSMGLAWLYWFRILGALLSTYEVCMMLTKKNKVAASVCAFLFAFSPLVQWWNCHNLVECIIYGQMMLAGGYYYLENINCVWKKIVSAVVVCFSAVGFVVMLMPAILVPFGYLILLIAAVIVVRYVREGTKFHKSDIFITGSAVLCALLIVGRFILISKDDMALTTSTVFPGDRFSTGGELETSMVAFSFYQWALPFNDVMVSNSCEASQIIPLTLPILIAFPYVIVKDKENRLRNITLYGAFLFDCAWLIFPFPYWFAYLTLMSNVPANRFMWTVSIITIYLLAIIIDFFKRKCVFPWKYTLAITAGTLAVLGYTVFSDVYPFRSYKTEFVIIAAAITVVLCITLFRWHKNVFAVAIVIFMAVSGMNAQPLNIGVGSVYNHTLSEKVAEIKKAEPDAMWIVDSFHPMANFLLFNNVKVFNASNLYPDYAKWELLDPNRENEFFYNRYCQVQVEVNEAITEQAFFYLLTPEYLKVFLSADHLKNMPVKYILSRRNLDDLDDEISIVSYDAQSEYYIYEIGGSL